MILVWLGLALGVYAASSSRRSTRAKVRRSIVASTGVEVSRRCDVYTVTDPDRARMTFQRTYADARLAGDTDPARIAKSVMRRIDPQCVRGVFPRNPGQLDFYAEMYEQVIGAMLEDGVLSPDEATAHHQHFARWHDHHVQRLP